MFCLFSAVSHVLQTGDLSQISKLCRVTLGGGERTLPPGCSGGQVGKGGYSPYLLFCWLHHGAQSDWGDIHLSHFDLESRVPRDACVLFPNTHTLILEVRCPYVNLPVSACSVMNVFKAVCLRPRKRRSYTSGKWFVGNLKSPDRYTPATVILWNFWGNPQPLQIPKSIGTEIP